MTSLAFKPQLLHTLSVPVVLETRLLLLTYNTVRIPISLHRTLSAVEVLSDPAQERPSTGNKQV